MEPGASIHPINTSISTNESSDSNSTSSSSSFSSSAMIPSTSKPNQKQIIASTDNHSVRLWDVDNGQIVRESKWSDQKIICFHPTQAILATFGHSCITVLDIKDTATIQRINVDADVECICWHSDGKKIICTFSSSVLVYDGDSGALLKQLNGHTYAVSCVTCSTNGRYIASASKDNTIRLWNADSYECIHVFKGHELDVNCVVFTPDSSRIVSSSDDGTIKIWNVQDGRCIQTLQGHKYMVLCLAMSCDGAMIASSGRDKTIRLWRLKDGSLINQMHGHRKSVKSLVFSADNSRLISGSDDATVRIWRVSDGQLLHTFQHDGEVTCLSLPSIRDSDTMSALFPSLNTESNLQCHMARAQPGVLLKGKLNITALRASLENDYKRQFTYVQISIRGVLRSVRVLNVNDHSFRIFPISHASNEVITVKINKKGIMGDNELCVFSSKLGRFIEAAQKNKGRITIHLNNKNNPSDKPTLECMVRYEEDNDKQQSQNDPVLCF